MATFLADNTFPISPGGSDCYILEAKDFDRIIELIAGVEFYE